MNKMSYGKKRLRKKFGLFLFNVLVISVNIYNLHYICTKRFIYNTNAKSINLRLSISGQSISSFEGR